MPNVPYDATASRQYGLLTGFQLRDLGWTREQVRHAVRRGELDPLRRSVYRTAGTPRSREQAWLAAALAAPGSVLSHATAARAWAFAGFLRLDAIDLLRQGNRPRLDGVRGHETDSLPSAHVTVRHRLPVTTAPRTLVDGCRLVPPKQLRSAVNDGLRRRILTLPGLARTVDEVPVSGRRAIVPMVELLKERIPGYDAGDSDPEVDLVELLLAAGFRRPVQQVRVATDAGTRFVDVGWPDLRVGFEYDSLEFHQHRFHEDRDRLRALKRAGWDVWPVTRTTSRNEILAIATLAFRRERAA